MPDLDLIKQGQQGVRDRRAIRPGRPGNTAGRLRGCRDHINRAARLLLAEEGGIEPAMRTRRLGQSRNSGTIQNGFWPRATRSKLSKALRQRFQ